MSVIKERVSKLEGQIIKICPHTTVVQDKYTGYIYTCDACETEFVKKETRDKGYYARDLIPKNSIICEYICTKKKVKK